MSKRYAQIYSHGIFDDTVLINNADAPLTETQRRQLEHDQGLIPLTYEELRSTAVRFAEQITQTDSRVKGIKLCTGIESFVVVLEGPEYTPVSEGNSTEYPALATEVVDWAAQLPEVFDNFRRSSLFDVETNAFPGGYWLEE